MDEDKEKIKTKFFEGTTNMRNYWYPIAPSNEVLDTMPCGHYILGDPIVIYRDPNTKKPVALEDKCAHRSVKLSDGRIRAR
jgi:phenylpropionate dioxygenase-like ring-hydroxylating dioxygenase large terminal subunit